MRLALLFTLAFALATPASAATVKVAIDQSTRITLSRPARDVVVGNPAVADVNLADSRNIVVLGKGFGATSLLVMDKDGRTIVDYEVVVSSPDAGAVSLFRGSTQQTFSCATRCEQSASKAFAVGRAAALNSN